MLSTCVIFEKKSYPTKKFVFHLVKNKTIYSKIYHFITLGSLINVSWSLLHKIQKNMIFLKKQKFLKIL